MREVSRPHNGSAMSGAGTSASRESSNGKSASDDSGWFSEAACGLHGKPGLELHLLTDFDERLCYRYASDAVRPSAYFLRRLLRSEQGERWLNAVMDGSEAAWFQTLQRDAALGRKVRSLQE